MESNLKRDGRSMGERAATEIGVNFSPDLELILFYGEKHLRIQLSREVAKVLAAKMTAAVQAQAASRN